MVIRRFQLVRYDIALQAMQALNARRDADTEDEIWVLQHPPVYTLGLGGKAAYWPSHTQIPCFRTDRGGQITYHGPGQLIVYLMWDLKRRGLGVRQLVLQLEQALVNTLSAQGIAAYGDRAAPGVYVGDSTSYAKIASVGLRVRRGCCYHGIALNIDMDLSPFSRIQPCGFLGLRMTQTRDLHVVATMDELADQLLEHLQ